MRSTLLVLVVGCTPLAPFQTLETARPLDRGSVLVSVGAMAGAGQPPGLDTSAETSCCKSGVARVRVGIDGKQDVGVDGYVISDGIWAGKLAYKRALTEHVAIATGAGGTVDGHARDTSVGGNVGVIGSTNELDAIPHGRVYAAFQINGAIPLHADRYDNGGGPTLAVTAPVGLAVEHGPWQFDGELGAIVMVDRNNAFMDGATGTYRGAGAYAIVAAGYVFGR